MSPPDRLLAWLKDEALPFWAGTGLDHHGGWYEYLHPDGTPAHDAIRRLRVTARQVFTYGVATDQNWYDGRDIVRSGINFIDRVGRSKNGAGYVHLLGPDLQVHDGRRDLYDHAFYLLAFAQAFKITGDDRYRDMAQEVFDFLNTALGSDFGGWDEGIPSSLPRRQNPHMHLFEAFMAWAKVDDNPQWRKSVDEIYGLLTEYFFVPEYAAIREFFNRDWSPVAGDTGQITEPGHAAEWIWLLSHYEALSGVNTTTMRDALYARLVDRIDGFGPNAETMDGLPLKSSKRMWVQTELIKAHYVQGIGVAGRAGDAAARARATALMNRFIDVYLRDDGTYIDQIDADETVISNTVPTSSLYHIIAMISEVTQGHGAYPPNPPE